MSETPIDVGTDDVRATPRKSGHRLLDIAIALTAIFISAVSLFVAIEHGRAQRQLVEANSWPFLSAEPLVTEDSASQALVVSNKGLGPAKIEYVQFFYKGVPVTSPLDLLRKCCGGLVENGVGINVSLLSDTVLLPGEQVKAFGFHIPKTDVGYLHRLQDALLSLKFKACYCSIFDECWLSDLHSLHPQNVKSCPANDHPFSNEDVLRMIHATR